MSSCLLKRELCMTLVYIIHVIMAAEEMITREVCHLEVFEASCPKSHVILVDQALYGSMELNRCITTAFGYEGCQADVLPLLDKQCSGRQRCSFSVAELHGRQYVGPNICPAELTSYLFIRYTCKQVLACDPLKCQSAGLLKPTPSNHGTLSSEMTLTSGCGSPACPWQLEAQPGQLFNLTLVDLWPRNHPLVEVTDAPGPFCHRYASISEHGYTTKDVTSCGRDYQRQAAIYRSHTNKLIITLYEPKTDGASMHFLIAYQVTQCPDMEAPADAVITRHGDQLKVKCTTSLKSWTLVCQGTAWVGEIGICDSAQTADDDNKGRRGSPFGMLIVVGLGVALGVLIGMVLLVVVFVFMRKRRRREFITRQNTLLSDFSPSRDHVNNKFADRGATLPAGGAVRYIPDHSFTATIQLKRQQTCPDGERPDFTLLTSDCLDDDVSKPCKLTSCPAKNIVEKNCLYDTSPNNISSAGYPAWQMAPKDGQKAGLDILAKDKCRHVSDSRN